jgi:hypothetical protein
VKAAELYRCLMRERFGSLAELEAAGNGRRRRTSQPQRRPTDDALGQARRLKDLEEAISDGKQ